MNNIIKKINNINTNININLKYINLHDLINQILSNDILLNQNNLLINDIKEYNDRQKIILNMFISDYVHLYPIVPLYSRYIQIINEDIDVLNYTPIFRSFYNSTNILNIYKSKLNLISMNILQVGTTPTFIESINLLNLNKTAKLDFIQIFSSKISQNQDIYNNLISELKDFNLINSLQNFYTLNLNELLSNKLLLDKYDLIIFDTYKNISTIDTDNIKSNINIRYLTSIINSKYILFQIIFAINKLNICGDLILLFSGSNHIVYQQIITILCVIFENVSLVHSEIDFSYRFFVICKKLKSDHNKLFNNQITIDNSNDSILVNILDKSNQILDINFEKNLQTKFNMISKNILIIEEIFTNQSLIDKFYNNYYYYQLNNTYKWLNTIFKNNLINNQLIEMISTYKSNLSNKISKYISITEYLINKLDDYILEYIGENIDNNLFPKLINFIDYLPLFNIVNKNTSLQDKYKIDIESIINKYNLNEPLYIEDISLLVFDNLKNQIIIKFNLSTINPYILSVFYILVCIYEKSIIIGTNIEYYFVCMNLIKDYKLLIKDFNELYNLNKKKINDNFQIVIYNEDFINQINTIFNKLFIKLFINTIRFNFLSIDN